MWSTEQTRIIDALVEYAPQLLAQTPCSLGKVSEFLVTEGAVASSRQTVAFEMIRLALRVPNTIILENEQRAGYFLIFYHIKSLAELVAGNHGTRALVREPKQVVKLQEDALKQALIVELGLANTSLSAIEDLKSAIENLANRPTALEVEAVDDMRAKLAKIPVIEVCHSDSYSKCKRNKRKCSSKIHFEKVLAPHSDPSLGDCSYLDTCFKGKQCKYVHYQIRYPNTLPPKVSTMASTVPSQHINANLLELDLSLLGDEYRALIIDPPWDIHTRPGSPGGCSDADVMNLAVEKLQKNGVVFLWVTGRVLDLGRQCLAKWGYSRIEEMIWLKTNQVGRTICTGRTGHWLNHTKEHVLIGVKGSFERAKPSLMDSDVIVSNALGRSQKPDELYGIIDRLVGPEAKKLELFGRKSNLRPGWLTIGNEMGSTHIIDPKLRIRLQTGRR